MNWLLKKKKPQPESHHPLSVEQVDEPEPDLYSLTREELRVCAYLQRVFEKEGQLAFSKKEGLCRCAQLSFTQHSLWMNNREIVFQDPFDLYPYVSELAKFLEKPEKEDCTYLSKEEVHELLNEAIKVMKEGGRA